MMENYEIISKSALKPKNAQSMTREKITNKQSFEIFHLLHSFFPNKLNNGAVAELLPQTLIFFHSHSFFWFNHHIKIHKDFFHGI